MNFADTPYIKLDDHWDCGEQPMNGKEEMHGGSICAFVMTTQQVVGNTKLVKYILQYTLMMNALVLYRIVFGSISPNLSCIPKPEGRNNSIISDRSIPNNL